jgi:hypothetical protein
MSPGPSQAGERTGTETAFLSTGDARGASLRMGVLGMRGLAVFVLVVVMDVDTDKRVDVNPFLIGEFWAKEAETGEPTTDAGNVGVRVEADIKLLVGENGADREESDTFDARAGDRRLKTD